MSKTTKMNRRDFLALSASAAGVGVGRRKRPNILLIVADDLKVMDAALFSEGLIGLSLPTKPVRTLEAAHG